MNNRINTPFKKSPLNILIVDDQTDYRKSIVNLTQKHYPLSTIAEASDGEDALSVASVFKPHLALMDIVMPRMNGVEATRRLLNDFPATKVIALSMYRDDVYVSTMLKAGACGYVVKDQANRDLPIAIEHALHGKVFLSPVLTKKVSE